MNLELTDEQQMLQEATRDALSRTPHIAIARAALDGDDPGDLWPTACAAGWPGLLVSEANRGAGLGLFDAMLVMNECGRVLAPGPLIGHLVGSLLLDRAGSDATAAAATGERRVAYVHARPPGPGERAWTVGRAAAPTLADGRVSGAANWVLDARGADLLVVTTDTGQVVLVAGAQVEDARAFDMTRSLGHVTFDGDTAVELNDADPVEAWYVAHALLAAEALGSATACLDMAVEYAKQRFTFGRAIGSYQAIKHTLVEVLRMVENARSLLYYVAWAAESRPAELALAASAARGAAGRALDEAARANISVHGGIGATWEHDAPLYFRRAQLSRRLLGGTDEATDRVALELLAV
jgi:alkylation response protein AidB-like acyl-CoA dehydrogenase